MLLNPFHCFIIVTRCKNIFRWPLYKRRHICAVFCKKKNRCKINSRRIFLWRNNLGIYTSFCYRSDAKKILIVFFFNDSSPIFLHDFSQFFFRVVRNGALRSPCSELETNLLFSNQDILEKCVLNFFPWKSNKPFGCSSITTITKGFAEGKNGVYHNFFHVSTDILTPFDI